MDKFSQFPKFHSFVGSVKSTLLTPIELPNMGQQIEKLINDKENRTRNIAITAATAVVVPGGMLILGSAAAAHFSKKIIEKRKADSLKAISKL